MSRYTSQYESFEERTGVEASTFQGSQVSGHSFAAPNSQRLHQGTPCYVRVRRRFHFSASGEYCLSSFFAHFIRSVSSPCLLWTRGGTAPPVPTEVRIGFIHVRSWSAPQVYRPAGPPEFGSHFHRATSSPCFCPCWIMPLPGTRTPTGETSLMPPLGEREPSSGSELRCPQLSLMACGRLPSSVTRTLFVFPRSNLIRALKRFLLSLNGNSDIWWNQ